MFQPFQEIIDNRHQYAQAWKERTGGRVVGYFCSYVPEEMLVAAGALPVRILGSLRPQDLAEAHIPSMYCPFSRDCLSEGLAGTYDYLDGVVMAKSCMHLQQSYECWIRDVPTGYYHFITMPWILEDPESRTYFLSELREFQKTLEAWSGVSLDDEALGRGIELYNSHRRLMHRLYDLRRPHPPLVSGTEAATIVLSSMLSDKAEHNKLLTRVIDELPGRKDPPRPGPRLMIAGGENYDLELPELVESLGANVVIEELCMGSRYFWNEVPDGGDRMEAIADRYLKRPPCPAKASYLPRFQHVLKLVRDFNVQGVLLIQQKFCSPHALDIPDLTRFLQAHDVPSYFFELDTTLARGQLRTRTEAFLETLELELV
ncbi:MAG: 2-hydroxyacyl-CoA dehydratase subunit D [Dehalococcoidia bacterium]